jgi:hypothetical protein
VDFFKGLHNASTRCVDLTLQGAENMSEAPKLSYVSPIEKYLDQIGHWLVVTTAQMDRGERKSKPSWKQFDDTHHWDSTAEEWIPKNLT